MVRPAGVGDDGEDLAVLLQPVARFGGQPAGLNLDDGENDSQDDGQDDIVELPFVYVPPPSAAVDAAAGAAPLLSTIEVLRSHLGAAGKPLTDDGNVEPGDARVLAELLETGDDAGRRGAANQNPPGVTSAIAIAKHAGAVEVRRGRLVAVSAWSARTATDRATGVYRAILELGALGSRGNTYELFDTVDAVIDSGTVHWLAAVLAPGAEGDLDEIVEQVEAVLRDELGPHWPQWSGTFERLARNGIERLFQTLQAAGIIEWIDPGEQTFRLTALGRHLVADDLPKAGYTLRRADELADASAATLIEALDLVTTEQRRQVVESWRQDRAVGDRVAAITGAIAADSALRLNGFVALAVFDPDVVAPAVRGMVDGPAGGHAAMYLLSRGLAAESEVGRLIDIATFVETLAAALHDPQELCMLFGAKRDDDQFAVLEQMWHHPAEETQSVLDALGTHLPDRALAKAARKAAVKHRSWIANRN